MTSYLFRLSEPHYFLTTDDPTYRYETLCGHCDYPIEPDDPVCPRCQLRLEDCIVCRRRTHRRAPLARRDPSTGVSECSLCRIHRLPFGRRPVTEMSGVFCTNLYGCPAGGMLVRSDELVVWPGEANLCLICRNEEFRPRPAKTFAYHVRQCLFCSTLFGLDQSWRDGWTEMTRIDRLGVDGGRDEPCLICGRSDHLHDQATVLSHAIDPWDPEARHQPKLSVDAYLRVVELGRALALFADSDRDVVNHLFGLWFDPLSPPRNSSEGSQRLTVGSATEHLLQGTLHRGIHSVLQHRIEAFISGWKAEVVDLDYPIAETFRPDSK